MFDVWLGIFFPLDWLTFQGRKYIDLLLASYHLAAGHAMESFTDFVVGHGELWSASMLSAVIRKV